MTDQTDQQARDIFDEALDVAQAVSKTAFDTTKHSGPGILGLVLASCVLAKSQDWPRQDVEAAFQASLNYVYKRQLSEQLH